MSILPLHRPAARRGRTVSNVAVIVLPGIVWTTRSVADRAGKPAVVHRRHDHSGLNTACGRSLSLFGIDTTVDMRLRDDTDWCGVCWPGRRCHCGTPSGQATECTACGAVATDADVRIGRAEP